MKYLILIAVVFAVIWFVRNNRRSDTADAPAPRRKVPGEPQDMVECPICSVHLPRTDALPGPDGRLYCCAEHRVRGS
ncbi:MAG: PP0621 family protein [Pseudomonadota bacterium]